MARGNQRDKAREKTLKDAAGTVSSPFLLYHRLTSFPVGQGSTVFR